MPKPNGLKDLIPKNPVPLRSRNIVCTTTLFNFPFLNDRCILKEWKKGFNKSYCYEYSDGATLVTLKVLRLSHFPP